MRTSVFVCSLYFLSALSYADSALLSAMGTESRIPSALHSNVHDSVRTVDAQQHYLTKFMTYLHWCQNLPTTPNPDFIAFIDQSSPLTHKLREKWLYQLAKNKDWATYIQFYHHSTDTNLQCYEQLALYNQGKIQAARFDIASIWLNGGSQPKACDELFTVLLKSHEISNDLLTKRIGLALEKRNLSLARYLLKQYNPPKLQEIALLTAIQQSPSKITQLTPSVLHGEFYLYGLKSLITKNMNQAIQIWNNQASRRVMNEPQQQSFLAMVALYKAMRNQDDAPSWFAKIKPAFYNDSLLDWEIRYALAHKNWQEVIFLITHSKNQEEPGRQYWYARALEALGHKEKANERYQKLALKRNYYGFLACFKLHKKPTFESEAANQNLQILAIYKPITDQIRDLYTSNQSWLSSRLLNDFNSELPKSEKSVLAYWVREQLHWHGKSVFLSNNETLNNQLSLRFPLVYQDIIQYYAKQYHIQPELIYAMIRQESAFFDGIVSTAGANGLMQLMPITAKLVAKRAKIPYANPKELFSTQKNINIGTAYLQQLTLQFHSHPVLIVAAYNAGPRQVTYWLKNHPPNDMDIWIETLPWGETRNYLKNVIAFYMVYQYRLQQKPNLNPFLQPFK